MILIIKRNFIKFNAILTTFLLSFGGVNLSTPITAFADSNSSSSENYTEILPDRGDEEVLSAQENDESSTEEDDDSLSDEENDDESLDENTEDDSTSQNEDNTSNDETDSSNLINTMQITNATTGAAVFSSAKDAEPFNINIDGDHLNQNPANLFNGVGTVTGNNSSRLLLDYREKNPKEYWKIMKLLFGKDGANLSLVKIEFGSDVNSSSGTEPSTMRYEDEKADASRGAGFVFASDAKKINPDLKVDLLRWSEPKWVSDSGTRDSENLFEARYKWFKDSIESAYEKYNMKFDYISPDSNETQNPDAKWIVYFANRLHNDTSGSYDYSKIKIVASDEYQSLKTAKLMMEDEDLRNAVDVISTHYNAKGDDNSKYLKDNYNKEIWYSEGSAPCIESKYGKSVNESGLTGTNGTLDIMNRIIASYAWGDMTMYEFQPAVAAYYSGAKYAPKQILQANTPWSGYYEADAGLYAVAHFTQFIKPGWKYVDGASFCNGQGGKPVISNAESSYLTAADEDSGNYSTVIVNDTPDEQNYNVTVSNLKKASSKVQVWETTDSNWFKNTGSIKPKKTDVKGVYTYETKIKPYSIVTLTTTKGQKNFHSNQNTGKKYSNLDVNYSDDFEYSDDFLERRGNAPLYTTDQGGAFEVADADNNKVLKQIITSDIKPNEWGHTPSPTTSLGDDEWSNYSASIDVMFDENSTDSNYTGIGTRYNCAELNKNASSGIYIKLFKTGDFELYNSDKKIANGNASINTDTWNNLKIYTAKNVVKAYINNEEVANVTLDNSYSPSGRVCLISDYYNNIFDNLKVSDIDGYDAYVTRIDDMDETLNYSGTWTRKIPDSYTNYNRSISTASGENITSISHSDTTKTKGTLNKFYYYKPNGNAWSSNSDNAWSNDKDSSYEVKFDGTGVKVYAICNKSNGTSDVYIDDEFKGTVSNYSEAQQRKCVYETNNLSDGEHVLKVVCKGEGYVSAAGIEVNSERDTDNSLDFKFKGTGFNIVGGSNSAKIEVSVDGENLGTFDTPASNARQLTFESPDLKNKSHKVSIKVVSGTYTIDAIEIHHKKNKN